MVSRRNFISIILMMSVLFFMFQFSQVIKTRGNNFNTNKYIVGELNITVDDVYVPDDDSFVIFFGTSYGSVYPSVEEWCTYTKQNVHVYPTPAAVPESEWSKANLILVDSDTFDSIKWGERLAEEAAKGNSVVFCNLPDSTVIRKNLKFRDIVGIKEVKADSVTVEGIDFFDGFFIGGETAFKASKPEEKEYEDIPLDMPWYTMTEGVTAYGIGLMDEDIYEANEFPRIIWKKTCGDGYIVSVNGDFISSDAGFGFLSSIKYEVSDYYVYPVVNARNTVVTEFPFVTDENSDKIFEEYSMTPTSLCRDVVWPSLLSITEINHLRLTCTLPCGYDAPLSENASDKYASFYLAQLNEINGEAALSANYKDHHQYEERFDDAKKYWNTGTKGYLFGVCYAEKITPDLVNDINAGKLTGVRTIVSKESDKERFYFLNDGVLAITATNRAEEYSYAKELKHRSEISALGYANILIDMHQVQWPEDDEDEWQNLSTEISGNIHTYWGRNDYFDYTAVSESDYRIREFERAHCDISRSDNVITIEAQGANEAYYILRTHNEEIKEIYNGDYVCLESDVYLIHCYQTTVQIRVDESDDILSFKGVL